MALKKSFKKAFRKSQTHPAQTPATEYTLTMADGRTIVMVSNSATPDKVFFAGTTSYHSREIFEAGVAKVIASGGTMSQRSGWDFA